jgi:hypothetical protein
MIFCPPILIGSFLAAGAVAGAVGLGADLATGFAVVPGIMFVGIMFVGIIVLVAGITLGLAASAAGAVVLVCIGLTDIVVLP